MWLRLRLRFAFDSFAFPTPKKDNQTTTEATLHQGVSSYIEVL